MSLIDYHTPEPAVLRKPWRSRPRAYDCISRRYGPNTVLLRAVAVRVFEDVYNAGSGFEDGRMFRSGRDVVGLARLVGTRLAVYGRVMPVGHTRRPAPCSRLLRSAGRLISLRGCIRAQPQRDVGWLHRLPDHS